MGAHGLGWCSAYLLRYGVQGVQHLYRERMTFFVRVFCVLFQDVLYELDALFIRGDKNGIRGHFSSFFGRVHERYPHRDMEYETAAGGSGVASSVEMA